VCKSQHEYIPVHYTGPDFVSAACGHQNPKLVIEYEVVSEIDLFDLVDSFSLLKCHW